MTRDYSSVLFTPEQVGNRGHEYIQQRRDNKEMGVKIGLPSLDKDIYPLMAGELLSIIARPGCGKTGFMMRWARERSRWLASNNIKDRSVVYVTLEQSIEELNAFNLAAEERISVTTMARGEITDEEWKRCLKQAVNRRFLPLWNIGYSSMTTVRQISLDADAIRGALELIREQYKLTIDIVFVDYLQRMPINGRSESKTVGTSDNLDELKNIALSLKCPVVTGVQAKREVDQKKPDEIPDLDDGQWTSNIEQTSDRVLSLVRPQKYRQDGEMFQGKVITGKNQMIVSCLKQKLGKDNFSKWVMFDPEFNRLDELEMR